MTQYLAPYYGSAFVIGCGLMISVGIVETIRFMALGLRRIWKCR